MKHEWIDKYMYDAERMIVEGGPGVNEGLKMLNELLYEEPGYGRLHNHLGWAHLYYTFDIAQAEVHFKAAIKFHGEFQAPYLHLGTLYVREAKYAEAIDVLNKGLTAQQANKAGMLDLIGQAYEMQREYKLAIKAYREAMLSTFATSEVNIFSDSIKRCRKKRWSKLLN